MPYGAPSSDRTTATQREAGNFAQISIMISVSGTERKAPGIPHKAVQKASESRVATGLMF